MSAPEAAPAAAAAEAPQQPPTLFPSLDAGAAASLSTLPFAFVVADARTRDYPIVHCSPGFSQLTGYGADEVLGKNCRFLQGPGTSRRKVAEIRDALREERACRVCLLNYKKDGTPFWNLFHLSPVRDETPGGGDASRTALYIGVQTDVTALVEKARARRAAAAQEAEEEQDEEEASARAAADAVAEDAAAVAEGDVRRLTRALSRSGISNGGGAGAAAAAAPAEDTSDEEEVAALYSLEEGEAGAVRRALPCASSAFPAVPARLLSHLFRVPSAFVLSDPRKNDCPIVFASDAFLRMTGYGRDEVVGRNCRFLQQRRREGGGSGSSDTTSPNAAAEAASASELSRLREALAAEPPRPATVTLLNYKKDGTPFWNALHVAPVRDADGRVEFYVGVQLDVTGGGGGGGEEAAAAAAPAAPLSLPQRLAHSSTTGAVRVACRSLMGEAGGLRRSVDWQALPKRGWCSKQQQQGGGGGGGAGGAGGAA